MHNYIKNSLKNSYGLSLVELMIAMTISAILMLGIIEIFRLNSGSYKVQDENARMQESGRYAFNMLMTDIRRSGYYGGNANKEDTTGSIGIATPARDCKTSDTSWGRMIERPLYGLNDGNTNTDKDSLAVDYSDCIPDADYTRGDILVTRYTKGSTVTSFDADRLYIRNSLFSGRLFKGSQEDYDGTAGKTPTNQVAETPNAARELAAIAYYVGPSGRTCTTDDTITIPALNRKILGATGLPEKEEVANGIEHIQFQYGLDSDGDLTVNRYYNANQLSNNDAISPNWSQVVTVRFWVLVRADCPTNGYNNTKTYAMGDINYTPNDSFKRQLYSTTVAVRN